MDLTTLLNYTIALVGLTMCGAAIVHILVGSVTDRMTAQRFLAIFLCLGMFTACSFAGLVMRGAPGGFWRTMIYIANFGEFFFVTFLEYIMTRILLGSVDRKKTMPHLRTILNIMLGIQTISLVISQFTGLYYIIDENNTYQRTAGYPASYIIPLGMMLIAFWLLTKFGYKLTQRERRAFWFYYIFPLAAMCVQIFVYGLYFVSFALIVAAIVMYMLIISEQRERFYKQREDNEKLKTDIMLSQIQPHFLYNTLSTIQVLCYTDPEKAAYVTEKFGTYLRQNLDTLGESELIPVDKELEHIYVYSEIEMTRFPQISLRYDIEDNSFNVPPLSIQPLVENAIRHGVRIREEGIVTVSTRFNDGCHEVIVHDNGKGFDVSTLDLEAAQSGAGRKAAGHKHAVPWADSVSDQDDDSENYKRRHIGLANVRDRIKLLCGGTLKIESTPGEGTTVTIRIPEE